jgi:hypothetical protein
MNKSNSVKSDSIEQPPHSKKTVGDHDLIEIKLPSHFPFNDLMCNEENKDIFENLFNEQ